MSEDYDPIRDRLDEKLYKDELEPIRMKFIEFLVDNKIDPVNMIITRPVVEDVIKLMGVDYRDWKNFTMTDEDYTKIGIEDMKSHLEDQLKRNCKPLKAAMKKLKAEREKDQALKQELISEPEDIKPQSPVKPEINIGKGSVRRSKNPAIGQQVPTK